MTTIEKPEGKLIPLGTQDIFVIEVGEGGVPLIFLHGGGPGGNSWLDFSPVLPYFMDRKVVFLDLPQYGGSTKNPIEGPSWSYHARHIVGAMDALGIEKADFACSSVGGSAALCTAANYPERVRRVVCSGSQPTFDIPGGSQEQYGLGAKWVTPYYADEGPTYEKTKALILGVEWVDPATLPEARIQERLAGSIANRELMATPGARGEREDLTEKLKTITAPCLFFWGKQDPFLDPEYALYLSRLVEYGDVHVMNKASHHLFAERPKDYSLVLHSFLDADL